MFDFRRATIFCSGRRFSNHKMSRNLGAMAPWAPLAAPMDSNLVFRVYFAASSDALCQCTVLFQEHVHTRKK